MAVLIPENLSCLWQIQCDLSGFVLQYLLQATCRNFPLRLKEIFNAEVLFREDCTADELIDVIVGNRVYMPCLYVS